MPHTYTDQTEPIRSGVAKLFFWMGLALAGVGVVMGVTFIVWGLLTTNDDGLVTTGVILGPLFLAAGALMHLGGRRQWVRLLPDGIVWRTVFSGPTYVPWREVHHVAVPLSPSEGHQVLLAIHDGRWIPVPAIRMSSANTGRWADGGYRKAGAAIVDAHKGWLATSR